MKKDELQQLLINKWLHQITNDGDIIVVDPWKIAKDNNINVYFADLAGHFQDKDASGLIQKKNGVFEIYIEETHHINRQRFTLAHELGHYFLHMQWKDAENIFSDNKETILFHNGKIDKFETEANEFAAEYLMPEKVVREQYEKYGITELLAGFFKVSKLAMAIRINNIMGDE